MTSDSISASTNAEAAAGDLWHYAATVYQRPGLKSALLDLQDRHGIDVVMLLTCAFLAERGCRLESAAIAELIQAGEPVREGFVSPLRALRRRCAEFAPSTVLYSELKNVELQAERMQIDALAGCFGPWLGGGAATSVEAASVEAAIRAYWQSVVGGVNDPAIGEVVAILQGGS